MEEMVHKGHRSRMRRKFSVLGADCFDTYELLEMLLYYTVPVKDTNPISKKLLSTFGSLNGVFSAKKEELMTVDGIGEKTAEFISSVGDALSLFASDNILDKPPSDFESYEFTGEYVTQYFAEKTENTQLMLSFDNDMQLLGADEIYQCDYSSAIVTSSGFMNAALRRGATVVIIAHNHPYGPLCPTEGDRATNNMVQTSLSNVGIFLAEHYVVCGMRYVGFMNHLEHMFAQKPRIAQFLRSKRECENVTSK